MANHNNKDYDKRLHVREERNRNFGGITAPTEYVSWQTRRMTGSNAAMVVAR